MVVHIENAKLIETKFQSVYLDSAQFTESELSSATFHWVDLNRASFRRATLKNVTLHETKLDRASFWDTKIVVIKPQSAYEEMSELKRRSGK